MDNYYECGDGWLPLIKEAENIVEQYNKKHKNTEPLEFLQIKEKWGYLCMYLNYYVKDVQNKIDALEEKSHNICENCGSTKNVTTKAVNGWISTLCDKCRKVNENT